MLNKNNKYGQAADTSGRFFFYATISVIFAFVMQIFSIVFTVDGANIVLPEMVARLNITRTQASMPYAAGAYIGIITSFFLAGTIRKFGLKQILLPVICVTGVIQFFLSRVTDYRVYCALTIIMISLLNLLNFVPGVLAGAWFRRRRGFILGILTCGAPFSTAVVIPLIRDSVARYGFSKSYFVIGLLTLAFCLLSLLLLCDSPEKVGCQVDNGKRYEKNDIVSSPILSIKPILTSPLFWLNFISWNILNIVNIGIMSNMVPITSSLGFSDSRITLTQRLGGGLAIPLSILWGYVDDRFGTHRACRIIGFLYIGFASVMCLGSLGLLSGLGFVALISIGMGFTLGGRPNLQPSLVTWSFGGENYVQVWRFICIGTGFAKGTALWIMSYIYDRTGAYTGGFAIMVVFSIAATVCFFLIHRPYAGVAKQGYAKELPHRSK